MILKKVGKSKTLTVTPLGEPGVNGSILGTLASSLEEFEGSFLFFWAGFSFFFGGNVLSRCWRIWLFAIISLFLNYLAGFLTITVGNQYLWSLPSYGRASFFVCLLFGFLFHNFVGGERFNTLFRHGDDNIFQRVFTCIWFSSFWCNFWSLRTYHW